MEAEKCCPIGAHNCFTCRVCGGSYFGCKSCLQCISCQTCLNKQCVCCSKGSPKQKENAQKYGKK